MTVRRRFRVTGRVQGVGFRPDVVRLAGRTGVAGWVRNDPDAVHVVACGPPSSVDAFAAGLSGCGLDDPGSVEVREVTDVGDAASGAVVEPGDFRIEPSRRGGGVPAVVHDLGVCEACRGEVAGPGRRAGYLLTSCARCGPRGAILESLPWTRSNTTMADFPLCEACRREFDDVDDRRFHAEAIGCAACGPALTWDGEPQAGSADLPPIDHAVAVLARGGVVAVQGVGGFHLMGRADAREVVRRIREAKAREVKPLAVLVADVAAARQVVALSDAGERALVGPARPVVFGPRHRDARVDPSLAPDVPDLAVAVPATPVQAALVERIGAPLVLTSANRRGAPTAVDEDEVRRSVGAHVDGVLSSQRRIAARADDGIVRDHGTDVRPLRVGRGHAPMVLPLPVAVPEPVLAVGTHRKNTVAIAIDDRVVVSAHHGDQDVPEAVDAFADSIERLCRLVGVRPRLVAAESHPDAGPTRWAMEHADQVTTVDHHHAHVAAAAVDAGRSGTLAGLAFDGFGLGPDGTAWGGEALLVSEEATRIGHLRPVPLLGGDAAARAPWRMAVAWAATVERAWAESLHADASAVLATEALAMPTTSVGRLFDAVAFLAGGPATTSYEAQAALWLEARAGDRAVPGHPPLDVVDGVIDPGRFLAWIRDEAPSAPTIAVAFHHALARTAPVLLAGVPTSVPVALTGGVFTNRVLSAATEAALVGTGRVVLRPRRVPVNDAGISVGQVGVVAARLQT